MMNAASASFFMFMLLFHKKPNETATNHPRRKKYQPKEISDAHDTILTVVFFEIPRLKAAQAPARQFFGIFSQNT